MKKFSRASREISVTLICILACFFSAFDIAEGIFFQRLLISAGGELGGSAQKRRLRRLNGAASAYLGASSTTA